MKRDDILTALLALVTGAVLAIGVIQAGRFIGEIDRYREREAMEVSP